MKKLLIILIIIILSGLVIFIKFYSSDTSEINNHEKTTTEMTTENYIADDLIETTHQEFDDTDDRNISMTPTMEVVGYRIGDPTFIDLEYSNLKKDNDYVLFICKQDGGCLERTFNFIPSSNNGSYKLELSGFLYEGFKIELLKLTDQGLEAVASTGIIDVPDPDRTFHTNYYEFNGKTLEVTSAYPDFFHILSNQTRRKLQLFFTNKSNENLQDMSSSQLGFIEMIIEPTPNAGGVTYCHMGWCQLPVEEVIETETRTWNYLGYTDYIDAGVAQSSKKHIFQTIDDKFIVYAYMSGGGNLSAMSNEIGEFFKYLNFIIK